jgi:predicted RNase H-like HicB family nuclease
MEFLVAIEKGDEQHAYGVVVPALPGCFSAGDTLEEALENAREAILLHVEALLDAGQTLPVVDTEALVADARQDPERADWILAMVHVDPDALDSTAERINISMPRRVLHAIDRAAEKSRKTRSGFLAEAGLALASHH